MNKYLATIAINGTKLKTLVFADSAIHARLIVQYQFGMNSVVTNPVQITNETDAIPLDEVIAKIKPIKPLTPDQQRIKNLKNQVEQDKKRLQAEKLTQQQQRMMRRTSE